MPTAESRIIYLFTQLFITKEEIKRKVTLVLLSGSSSTLQTSALLINTEAAQSFSRGRNPSPNASQNRSHSRLPNCSSSMLPAALLDLGSHSEFGEENAILK